MQRARRCDPRGIGLFCCVLWACGTQASRPSTQTTRVVQNAQNAAPLAHEAKSAEAKPASEEHLASRATDDHAARRHPSPREALVVSELMRAAERVRQLRFAKPVPVWVENRARITEYVSTQIQEEELERARVVYTALGLLSPELDVRALLLRLLGEQVVGYYDPDGKQLVVRDDIMRGFAARSTLEADVPNELAEARIVLLHELVHALQDQQLGLSTHIHVERDTDQSNAFHALVEGDATLAMLGYALEREQIPLRRLTSNPLQVRSFSEVVRRSPLAGSELEQAPPIVRVPLLSSYVDGLSFCATLHGRGGFTAIDRAHTTPPQSTEQILHPERAASGKAMDEPTRIELADLRELEQKGYELIREDTLGELEMGVYFSQASADEPAKRAAEGWDGDRIRVYRTKDKQAAVVWLSVWDSERDAIEAQAAAERVRDTGNQANQALPQHSSVHRRGRWLLVLRELPEDLREVLTKRLLATR